MCFGFGEGILTCTGVTAYLIAATLFLTSASSWSLDCELTTFASATSKYVFHSSGAQLCAIALPQSAVRADPIASLLVLNRTRLVAQEYACVSCASGS
jgi:hypothetical protein